jgi:hypothetical protein
MESDLISYLIGERITELEQAHAAQLERERERERAAPEREQAHAAQLEQELIQLVEDAVSARFPATPVALVAPIRQVRDPRRLREMHTAVLQAPDQASVERLLRGLGSKRRAPAPANPRR